MKIAATILFLLLTACAATPPDPDAHSWYPGVSRLPPAEQMQVIQMDNADWEMERQREQEIWQRLTPQTVYVVR